MTTAELLARKAQGQKISMITCYDFTFAKLIAETDIDVILVGDSCAMVMHGHSSTLSATTRMMEFHTAAVARGCGTKHLVADMPFLSVRKGIPYALRAAERLMRAGAHAIKIEGVDGHEDVIRHLVQSGIPVMGHLGLTPQSIHQLGGYRVQGRDARAASTMKTQSFKLQDLGVYAIVFECVPTALATELTRELEIPTIGIGAGPDTDGQVLVLQDMLGLDPSFKPKFVRHFSSGHDDVANALRSFDKAVKEKSFPAAAESYK